MKHPVSAILFDKDGTLIDFEGTWTPFARAEALRAANGDGEKAENLLAVLGLDPTGTRFLPDSIVAAGTNAEVAAVLWAGVDPAELVARTHAFNERAALHAIKGTVMLPGMGEALNALRGAGFKLGIATNDVRQLNIMFNPGLNMQGGLMSIVLAFVFATAMVTFCSLALHGYMGKRTIQAPIRLVLVLCVIAIIVPNTTLQAAVLVAGAGILLALRLQKPPAADPRLASS